MRVLDDMVLKNEKKGKIKDEWKDEKEDEKGNKKKDWMDVIWLSNKCRWNWYVYLRIDLIRNLYSKVEREGRD